MRKILRLSIYLEVDLPEVHELTGTPLFEKDDDIEFFFDGSSHCKDNLLDGIEAAKEAYLESVDAIRDMTNMCTCFCSTVHVIQDVDLPAGTYPMKIEHY